ETLSRNGTVPGVSRLLSCSERAAASSLPSVSPSTATAPRSRSSREGPRSIMVGASRGVMPPAATNAYTSHSQLIGKIALRLGGAVDSACIWLPPVAEQPHMPTFPLLHGCLASHSVMSYASRRAASCHSPRL